MPERAARPRSVRIFALAVLSAFFLGALPILSGKAGYQFLPSEQWLTQTHVAAILLGGLAAAAAPFAVLKGMKMQPRKHGTFMKIILTGLAPFFAFTVFSHFVSLGIPLIVAIAAGTETRAGYTVSEVKLLKAGKCPNPIRIADMPFAWGELCNFPAGFVQGLEPGARITAEGRGTQMGLFVTSLSQQE
ncbi:hypothetical protein N6L27_06750 [Leisingera sp. SS27]|uniref:hypothetical protein n=1 Tax=Leisingera sp. SS27 TaxID=2979462 RepID=UPI00232DC88C|nr:hypothetical protein [Leisingera sp. SS27]MDC0657688.1 hypothetical protein [Leisingera sp. SS27]